MAARPLEAAGSSRAYKRGAIMGLTVAEAFILLTFVLLLLFTWWQAEAEEKALAVAEVIGNLNEAQKKELIAGLADGTFEMAKGLRASGITPDDKKSLADLTAVMHFMREENLKRLLDQASKLPPDTKLSLAQAVDVTPEPELKAALMDLVAPDSTFKLAERLREAGVEPGDAAAIADTAKLSRFIREEDLKRLLDGAVELAPGTRLTLANAVEITPEMKLKAALDELMSPDDAIAQVNARLAAAAANQERVVGLLNSELGEKIRAAGGAIAPDGTISLPQNILFDIGSARIRDPAFLREFCTPWIRTLQSAGMDISELKIEGHASSEGLPRQTPDKAYLYNLGLSQERAQNALRTCLDGLEDPATLAWARDHLSSTGYSSARLVRDAAGQEDKEASRRVMFSMEMNREQLLEDIRRDLEIAPAMPGDENAPAAAQDPLGGQRLGEAGPGQGVRVIDGDTLAIGGESWRLFGIDAPEMKQRCRMNDGQEYPCGRAARDALAALIGDLEVTCEQTDTDRYGRRVGICRAGGKDIGEELVSAGMAVPYLQYSDAYQSQGEAARVEKRGLWSGDFEMPNEFRKVN